MKKTLITFVIIIFSISNIGCSSVDKSKEVSQDTGKNIQGNATLYQVMESLPEEEKNLLLAQMLKDYSAIAGAWYVNQQCSVLSKNESTEFEFYVAQINVTLRKLTNNFNMLKAIQQSAKEVSKEFSSCNDDSEKIVRGAFDLSKKMNLVLTGKPYDKENSNRDQLLSKYKSIKNWINYSNYCKSVDSNIIDDVNNVVDKIEAKISLKYPKEVSLISKNATDNKNNFNKDSCSKVKSLNPDMLSGIRFMQGSLGIK